MDVMLQRILECMGDAYGSAKELSEAIGVNPQLITNWKNGHTKSYKRYIKEIAKFYGVSEEWLRGESEQKEKPLVNGDEELTEYLEELKNRKEMRMLFSLAKGATKADVEKSVKIIEALLGKTAEDD